MYCFNCGKQISEDVNFCPYCGKEQKAVIISPPVNPDSETEEAVADNPAEVTDDKSEDVVIDTPVEVVAEKVAEKKDGKNPSRTVFILFLLPPAALTVILFVVNAVPLGQKLFATAGFFSAWGMVFLVIMGMYWLFKRKWRTELFLCILGVSGLLWCTSILYDKVFLTVYDCDHNQYHIVQIGRQYWMTENLRVTHYADGSTITEAQDSVAWIDTDGQPKWCNSPGKNTGHLYNWYAVNDKRRICPAGWHVATDIDWQQLIDHDGGKEEAGNLLKDTESYTGFGATGNCYRGCHGYYYTPHDFIAYWTSTTYSDKYSWIRYFFSGNNGVTRAAGLNGNGFYVRCIKD